MSESETKPEIAPGMAIVDQECGAPILECQHSFISWPLDQDRPTEHAREILEELGLAAEQKAGRESE